MYLKTCDFHLDSDWSVECMMLFFAWKSENLEISKPYSEPYFQSIPRIKNQIISDQINNTLRQFGYLC